LDSRFTLILSYILNGILVRIVYKKSERVGFYRYFTYCFVIIDVMYSFAYSATQPFWYASPGIISFFSTAPWSNNFALTPIAMQLWFAAFVVLVLCITCSFAYRYGLLCRTKKPSTQSKAATLIFFAIIDVQLVIMVTGSDTDNIKYFHEQIYCGLRINQTVTSRAMSDKLKKIHRRALKMLIAQAINPLILFFFPTSINIIGMFADTNFLVAPKPLAFLYGLFPLINPIIVIYFTDDYKRYLLGQSASVSIPIPAVISSHNTSTISRRTKINSNVVFVV
ncbi:hypothetical protein PRIPAC_78326, partial [Pristionchus pacificus]|uniref:G protein-coupled receptor n=1 Tax=Pristionchus pacificus TaxID=54126 RepID=A0A2A6C302_PRIPA